ncbi:MAG: hypothetical protein ACLS8R_03545 [Anaeromassilibacillus sp.]
MEAAKRAISLLGCRLDGVKRFTLPGGDAQRGVHPPEKPRRRPTRAMAQRFPKARSEWARRANALCGLPGKLQKFLRGRRCRRRGFPTGGRSGEKAALRRHPR